jgi:hypothetical protein
VSELRAAIQRGLHLDNARAIGRLCQQLLGDGDFVNPIVVFTIQSTVLSLASSQDGVPVSADKADLIDAHLLPAIEELLDVSDGGPAELVAALNHVVRVHLDTLLV